MVTIYPIYFANTSSFLQNREKDGKIETNKKGVITMKFVIQRVLESAVKVDGETIGEIGKGLVVLEDENGKTNLSLADVDGSLLLISQFTLYANCKKGNRPSFIEAGDPKEARRLYEYIIDACKSHIPVVERGEFGADMKVSLINDGPFTIVLDSQDL